MQKVDKEYAKRVMGCVEKADENTVELFWKFVEKYDGAFQNEMRCDVMGQVSRFLWLGYEILLQDTSPETHPELVEKIKEAIKRAEDDGFADFLIFDNWLESNFDSDELYMDAGFDGLFPLSEINTIIHCLKWWLGDVDMYLFTDEENKFDELTEIHDLFEFADWHTDLDPFRSDLGE